MRNKIKIFISYAREDSITAKRLFDDLKLEGYAPWLDSETLPPGARWESSIQVSIRESDFFLALMSSNSVDKNGFIQKELREALSVLERLPDKAIYIIPARIDNCWPGQTKLESLNWVDLFPSYEKGFARILEVIRDRAAEIGSFEPPGLKAEIPSPSDNLSISRESASVKSTELPKSAVPSPNAAANSTDKYSIQKLSRYRQAIIGILIAILVFTAIVWLLKNVKSKAPVDEAAALTNEKNTESADAGALSISAPSDQNPHHQESEVPENLDPQKGNKIQNILSNSPQGPQKIDQSKQIMSELGSDPVTERPDLTRLTYKEARLQQRIQPVQPLAPTAGALYTDAFGIRFHWIPGGRFRIGSQEPRFINYQPEHDVQIQGFWLAETEFTQKQWRDVVNQPLRNHMAECDDCPVVAVSWYDAIEVANILSARTGVRDCYKTECHGNLGEDLTCESPVERDPGCIGYQLPTENEWEVAARAQEFGTEYKKIYGDPEEIAWYLTDIFQELKPAGLKAPNAWGLRDMIGSVKEWTWDIDPATGSRRRIRGDSHLEMKENLSAASRYLNDPQNRNTLLGFRLALGHRRPD